MPVQSTCENCGQPFYCYQNEIERGRRFCSLRCRSAFRFEKALPAASRTPVHFACQECGADFVMMASYLTAYRKKFGHDPMYCSANCSGTAKRKAAEANSTFACLNCGKVQSRRRKPGGRLYREQKFCDSKCKVEHQMKTAQQRFEAGEYKRHIKRHGYVWITVPALSSGGAKRCEMLEHRYVMEKLLGRKLRPDETVHHKDGNRQNNAPQNLELFSSRHGPGQRVIDKIDFAIEMIRLYPEFAAERGVKLVDVHGGDHDGP